jgi:hypothetical protein
MVGILKWVSKRNNDEETEQPWPIIIIEKNKNSRVMRRKRAKEKDIGRRFTCLYKEGHKEAYILLIVIIIFLYSYTYVRTRPHLPFLIRFLTG